MSDRVTVPARDALAERLHNVAMMLRNLDHWDKLSATERGLLIRDLDAALAALRAGSGAEDLPTAADPDLINVTEKGRTPKRAGSGEKITHGRHCICSACKQEDWTRITSPCGMHGADCPAVYAPLGAAGDRLVSGEYAAHVLRERAGSGDSEPTCEFGCGYDDDPSNVRPGYVVVAGCPVHAREGVAAEAPPVRSASVVSAAATVTPRDPAAPVAAAHDETLREALPTLVEIDAAIGALGAATTLTKREWADRERDRQTVATLLFKVRRAALARSGTEGETAETGTGE